MDWLWLRFWEIRGPKVEVVFIDETNHSFRAKKRYTNNQFSIRINGEDQRYNVDPKRVIRPAKGGIAQIFYEVGNPDPLPMQSEGDRTLSSVGYQQIMEDKVVRDLFSGDLDKLLKNIFMLSVIILVGVLATAYLSYKIYKLTGG